MTTRTDRTALITGASSGIGLELAKLFARDGWRLVLVARNRAQLEKLAAELKPLGSPEVHIISKDLAALESPDELFAETERRALRIDCLVNNAGFGSRGAFAKLDLDTALDMMQVNIVALTHLTRLYLDGMVSRRSGYIMNVASTAAFQPGPFMAVYFASKAFVLSFSEALYEEQRGSGVVVSCLCPGATATDFANRAGMAETPMFKMGAMDAPTVARIGYRGMLAGKPIVISGMKNCIGAFMVRFGPRSLVRRIVRNMQQ